MNVERPKYKAPEGDPDAGNPLWVVEDQGTQKTHRFWGWVVAGQRSSSQLRCRLFLQARKRLLHVKHPSVGVLWMRPASWLSENQGPFQ